MRCILIYVLGSGGAAPAGTLITVLGLIPHRILIYVLGSGGAAPAGTLSTVLDLMTHYPCQLRELIQVHPTPLEI